MRLLTISTVLASLAALTAAKNGDDYRPIVFYHGMGDSAHSKGMVELMQSIKDIAPEVFIHSVSVSFSGQKNNGKIAGHCSYCIMFFFFFVLPSWQSQSRMTREQDSLATSTTKYVPLSSSNADGTRGEEQLVVNLSDRFLSARNRVSAAQRHQGAAERFQRRRILPRRPILEVLE